MCDVCPVSLGVLGITKLYDLVVAKYVLIEIRAQPD